MITRTRAVILALVLAASASPAAAQTRPPEPLPMGTPYLYQPGNPYWYQPAYSSYYPFGATRPVFGRYSWDVGVYSPYKPAWYAINYPVYGYTYRYVDSYGRVVSVYVY
jgi:hypothetical protein